MPLDTFFLSMRIFFYKMYSKYARYIYHHHFTVPTDGVKGKTWGPSSGGHVLSSLGNTSGPKSRPSIPEERWSKSASNLEKSPKNKPGIPSVTSVPEMGKSYLNYLYKILVSLMIAFELNANSGGGFNKVHFNRSSYTLSSSSCQNSPLKSLLSSPFKKRTKKSKSKQKT